MYEKLIPLLLNASIMFIFLLKTKIILKCGENLIILEIFIFQNFQCAMGLDS